MTPRIPDPESQTTEMKPDAVLHKAEALRRLLADLEPFAGATLEEVRAKHYTIERILELLVTTGAHLVQARLLDLGVVADSYLDAYRQASAHGLLDPGLAARLEKVGQLREVLVSSYEDIDLAAVQEAIPCALRDFPDLAAGDRLRP